MAALIEAAGMQDRADQGPGFRASDSVIYHDS